MRVAPRWTARHQGVDAQLDAQLGAGSSCVSSVLSLALPLCTGAGGGVFWEGEGVVWTEDLTLLLICADKEYRVDDAARSHANYVDRIHMEGFWLWTSGPNATSLKHA